MAEVVGTQVHDPFTKLSRPQHEAALNAKGIGVEAKARAATGWLAKWPMGSGLRQCLATISLAQTNELIRARFGSRLISSKTHSPPHPQPGCVILLPQVV